MSSSPPLIRNISDTAFWVACYRARESERPDAVFHDPYARKLAGARGEEIAKYIQIPKGSDWAWPVRTILFDRFVTEQVQAGADMVINLAAGLDSRPYRLTLPSTLRWVEVDLPDLLAYKEEVLRDDRPVCKLERIPLDLSDLPARRALFERLGSQGQRILVMSEGLIIYLERDEVAALARDLAAVPTIRNWLSDLASPGLLRMLQKRFGHRLVDAGAPLKFAPPEGPPFFEPYGWRPVDVRSFLKTAAEIRRLPPFLHLLSYLPESKGKQGNNPWSAIIRLERIAG